MNPYTSFRDLRGVGRRFYIDIVTSPTPPNLSKKKKRIMSKNKIRATISFSGSRFTGQKIEVGYYDTKAQAAAAKAGAKQALAKWEELNPPKQPEKKKLPGLKTLVHYIHQGTYDKVIEEIAEAALGRYQLVKRHNYKIEKFPTSSASRSASYLSQTKSQALSAHL